MENSNVTLDDLGSIQDYLGSFDLFAGNEAEGVGYLHNSLHRILVTLDVLPPAPESGGRLLELGANPYFLTLLLKKFTPYELTLANYFGEGGSVDGRGVQVVTSRQYGEQHEFRYDHFNGEREQFPYPDGTFDVVLNCEILEHLTLDPTHFLCECHRVLKPSGYLLLTTPNVLAFQNLWRLGGGKNIYDLYSGYGIYGRHNREYTPAEVVKLLQACGFTVTRMRLEDICTHTGLTRWLKRFRKHWRDNIFAVAQASGRPIYGYPTWLYRSMLGLRRVVRSDIVMGENDTIQLGRGWHPLEHSEYAFRWTLEEARAYLLDDPDANLLGMEVFGWPENLGPTTLTVKIGSVQEEYPLTGAGWQEVYAPLPKSRQREIEVYLHVNPTRIPSELGMRQDDRVLGMSVKRLWLQ
jgi:SAM-dependent methyltransferase